MSSALVSLGVVEEDELDLYKNYYFRAAKLRKVCEERYIPFALRNVYAQDEFLDLVVKYCHPPEKRKPGGGRS